MIQWTRTGFILSQYEDFEIARPLKKLCYNIFMKDEHLYRASLQVASSILTGIASALLIELPLTKTWVGLTYDTFICILTTIAAIYIERYLQA